MQKLKGGITSAIHIILTYIEGDGEPLARCNVLPGKHCRVREEKKNGLISISQLLLKILRMMPVLQSVSKSASTAVSTPNSRML